MYQVLHSKRRTNENVQNGNAPEKFNEAKQAKKEKRKTEFRNENSNSDEQSILCNNQGHVRILFLVFFQFFFFVLHYFWDFSSFLHFLRVSLIFPIFRTRMIPGVEHCELWILNSEFGMWTCWLLALLTNYEATVHQILKRNRTRKRIKVIIKICIIVHRNKKKKNNKNQRRKEAPRCQWLKPPARRLTKLSKWESSSIMVCLHFLCIWASNSRNE